MATVAFMSDVTVFSGCPTRQCSSIEYLYTATPGLAGHHGQIIGTLVHGEPSVLPSAGLCEFSGPSLGCHYESPGVSGAFAICLQVGLLLAILGGWRPLGLSLTHTCSGGRFSLPCCAKITKTPRRDSTPFLDCRLGDGHGGE